MNPIEMMVKNMMQQVGGNPQAMVQNILKNNPAFANAIQGQNLQDMAMKQMQGRGIDPRSFMGGMMAK